MKANIMLAMLLALLCSCGGGGSGPATGGPEDQPSSSSSSSSSSSNSSSSSSNSSSSSASVQADTTLSNSLTLEAVGNSRTISVSFGFSENVRVGQFLDGSYFAVPAEGNSSVTINTLTSVGGPVRADENPVYQRHGLTDNTKNYGSHNATETLTLPVARSAATSIVAAIQKDEATNGNCGTSAIVGECLDAIFTLTILPTVPALNTLRPALSTVEKDLLTLDDFDLTEIPHINYFNGPGAPSDIEKARKRWTQQTEIFSVLDLDGQIFSEGGRAWRSDIYGGNYGSSTAQSLNTAWSWVMSADLNNAEEYAAYQGLIAALLVYGKDLYHAIYNGETQVARWGGGAGQSHGKIIPITLYATLKKDNAQEYSHLSQLIRKVGLLGGQVPPEMNQINTGINGPIWGDGADPHLLTTYDVGAYWGNILKQQCFDGASGTCNPNSGKKSQVDPHRYIDGPPAPGTAYYTVSFGSNQAFAAVMLLFPEVRDMINAGATDEYAAYKDASISFIQRVVTQGLHTAPDPCAPPDAREDPSVCDAYRSRNCEYYGLSNTGEATWGPDPADTNWEDGISCILNNSGGNTGQNGRFTSQHGSQLNPSGYITWNFYENWPELYRLYAQ
ncbi:hypothetical protein [Teredinibacter haidensis]|uniref:hypothetical protein n=1 Tax=Teredinibacter haidensis TaxID=2731755 RepID=UPI000A876E92|nr:hypothetical protein [Teredinibacter haidensis]